MTAYLLDTNIITGILKGQQPAKGRFQKLYRRNHEFLACPLIYFEVKRGLIARDSRRQMAFFEALFNDFEWFDYGRDDWQTASELWAKRRAAGLPISDADLLIAVFAINRQAVLVTHNAKDFDHLGVTLED